MGIGRLVVAWLGLVALLAAQSAVPGFLSGAPDSARVDAQDAEFHVLAGAGEHAALVARNDAMGLQFEFAAEGLSVTTSHPGGTSSLSLRLQAWGRDGHLRAVEPAQPHAAGARVECARDGIREWFVNTPAGLEHGFSIDAAPPGDAAAWLVLRVQFGGALRPERRAHGLGVALLDVGGQELVGYDGLRAWDASGRELPVALEVHGRDVELRVDAADAVYPLSVDPLISSGQALNAGAPQEAGATFGFAVSLDGIHLAVGSPGSTVAGLARAGKVFVFNRVGSLWNLQAVLTASDPVTNGRFGHSVALYDFQLVVGAPGARAGALNNAGAAYLFETNGASWSQDQKFTASSPAAGDAYGTAVAFDGARVVVGAPGNDTAGANAGRAYLLAKSFIAWQQLAQLTPTGAAAGDAFGSSVSIDSLVGIGAPGRSGGRGAAFVFTGSGSSWNQTAQLSAAGAAVGDALGTSVVLHGLTLVAGAPGYDSGVVDSGAAFVFVGLAGSWSEQARIEAPVPEPGAQLGRAVAFDGDRALLGAPGATAYSPLAQAWVATGAACMFQRTGTGLGLHWTFQGRFIAPDAQLGDAFGQSVAVDGNLSAVGIPLRDVAGTSDVGTVRAQLYSTYQTFTNLGGQLAPPFEDPVLWATGLLYEGTSGMLILEFARPLAPGVLFSSFTGGDVPFKGGVLVTGFPLFVKPLTTDAVGGVVLPWAAWPVALPPLSNLYFHFAVQDPAGPLGVVLSNGLRFTTPL